MDADSFSSAQDVLSKSPAPAHASAGAARRAPHPGCPFFGLLFFGHAKKSDSAAGRRTKRPPRRRAIWRHGTNENRRHWMTSSAVEKRLRLTPRRFSTAELVNDGEGCTTAKDAVAAAQASKLASWRQ